MRTLAGISFRTILQDIIGKTEADNRMSEVQGRHESEGEAEYNRGNIWLSTTLTQLTESFVLFLLSPCLATLTIN